MSLLAERRRLSVEPAPEPCTECGFGLWRPLTSIGVSDVGLYDDGRFPGRTIVSLREHYEHLDEVPEELGDAFIADVRRVIRAMKRVLRVERVNMAVLGNQESHVHAHLIPRQPATETHPLNSPWQDTRRRQVLPDDVRGLIEADLRLAIGRLAPQS